MVIEHEKTFEIIRKDYIAQLTAWLLKEGNEENCKFMRENDLLDQLTILQIRSLLNQIAIAEHTSFDHMSSELKIVSFNPRDPYLGIHRHNIFIGIEPDGYAHS